MEIGQGVGSHVLQGRSFSFYFCSFSWLLHEPWSFILIIAHGSTEFLHLALNLFALFLEIRHFLGDLLLEFIGHGK